MDGFVKFFAPRSVLDFLTKWILLYISVNILNSGVEITARGLAAFDFKRQFAMVAIVGGPFIAFALAMLGHQRGLQQKLVSLAATDMLTGLRNRRAFLADATEAHAVGDGGALLLLDADHFKLVNDTYGHDIGDLCLQAIADHLRGAVRPDDVVGRLGGEEFAIYLRNASPERARAVGERICIGFNLDEPVPNVTLRLTLSAGAVLARTGVSIEHGLAVADQALYMAKQAGRARVIFAPN